MAHEEAASPLAKKAKRMKERKAVVGGVRTLLASRSFQAVTFACALNDVGSWALVSWHATFYTRVFGIGPDIYAPMLAAIIPIGGIIGGVGSGLMGDWLSRTGNRHWLTAGVPPLLKKWLHCKSAPATSWPCRDVAQLPVWA